MMNIGGGIGLGIFEYLKMFCAELNWTFALAALFIFITGFIRARKLFMRLIVITLLFSFIFIGYDFTRVRSELNTIKDKVEVSKETALEHLDTLNSGLLKSFTYTIADNNLVVSYNDKEILRYDLSKSVGGIK